MFEEHKYEELKKLGLELHIPILESFLKLAVFDKDGKLVQGHSQRSHSWVRNAYNLMFTQLAGKDGDDSTFGAGLLSFKDTGGTIRYGDEALSISGETSADGTAVGYRAAAAEDSWGILLGSGTNAESFEDYALQTQIADGTGSGQISYVLSQAHSTTYTAGTKVFKNDLIRYFNNNSGASIAVNEVALVGRMYSGSGVAANPTVASRDHLASTINVADTGQLKVTYTVQITYPA